MLLTYNDKIVKYNKFVDYSNVTYNDLIYAYSLDNLNDSIQGNNIIKYGNAALDTSLFKNNSSYSFDGTGDYLLSTNNLGLDPSGSRTLSIWIYPKVSKQTVFLRYGANSTNREFGMWLTSSNQLAITVYVIHYFGSFVNLNEWTHCVLLYDADLQQIRMYKNGLLDKTVNKTLVTTDSQLSIGGRLNLESFNGNIDEVYVWNRGLEESEITSLYNTGIGKFYPF
jgi:hypothetical protein